jgi:hypothetical protein
MIKISYIKHVALMENVRISHKLLYGFLKEDKKKTGVEGRK